MRLSELLRERKEAILQEFEDFARTHTAPGISMRVEALRDHAAGMLDAMALDLEQPQTEAEQELKGKGDALAAEAAPRSAARAHGLARAEHGFSMAETFAEYRALRASVMRYYVASRSELGSSTLQDVIRFNEAIDQALAESITEYAQAMTGYRHMFLAVLAHDLRSPLNAILGASTYLAENSPLSGRDLDLAARIAHTATTMSGLIDDLLEFTSEALGEGITLRPCRADLGEVAADVIREAELSHPGREVHLSREGDAVGEWDASRLRQALSNLLTNALRHAPEDSPVTVSVTGDDPAGEVVAAVHNRGAPIPEQERELIFQPFRHGFSRGNGSGYAHGSVGLGLYIARRMAEAHGGTVRVESSTEAGTKFSMRLPRRPPGAPATPGSASAPT